MLVSVPFADFCCFCCVAASGISTSSSQSGGHSGSPSTPPASRTVMSSPFTVLSSRPEHAFSHIHPQGHQVSNCYTSTPPTTTLSGLGPLRCPLTPHPEYVFLHSYSPRVTRSVLHLYPYHPSCPEECWMTSSMDRASPVCLRDVV